jgi:hypothetical protein
MARASGTEPSRRGGHTATNFETLTLWSLWRRKAASISRSSTSWARTCWFTSATVDAVVSINRVATRVTKLRAKVASDVMRSSGCRVWSAVLSVGLTRYRSQVAAVREVYMSTMSDAEVSDVTSGSAGKSRQVTFSVTSTGNSGSRNRRADALVFFALPRKVRVCCAPNG